MADKFVLLQVGKLSHQKNQKLSILALKKVLKKIKNAVLIIVGDGYYKQDLISMAEKLNLQKKVIFTGFLTSEQISDWFKVADINLYPAKGYQSWGLVPIEAGCSGLISIVSDNCEVVYFLKRNNFAVISKSDPEEFVKAIIKIYKNPGVYKKMAMRSKKYIKEHLSWEAYTQRFIDLVNKKFKIKK